MPDRVARMNPAVMVPGAVDRDRTPREAIARWTDAARDVEHVKDGATFTFRYTEHRSADGRFTERRSADGRFTERRSVGGASRRYLRLTPPGWQSRAGVEAELAFVDAARAAGVHTPAALPSRDGARVEVVAGPLGPLLASVFEEAPGAALGAPDWSVEHARAFGDMVGRLHVASAASGVAPGVRPDWRDDLAIVRGWLPAEERAAHAALEAAERTLDGWPASAADFGLVHLDAGSSNLLWDGLTPWLIDFDDCCFHWYAADIAYALESLRRHPDRRALGRAFIAGYRAVRPFDDAWVERLPVLGRLRAIGALAWFSYSSWARVPAEERPALEAEFRAAIANPPALV